MKGGVDGPGTENDFTPTMYSVRFALEDIFHASSSQLFAINGDPKENAGTRGFCQNL